eukprot:3649800-Pleurochrysis_carterae.AAC.2
MKSGLRVTLTRIFCRAEELFARYPRYCLRFLVSRLAIRRACRVATFLFFADQRRCVACRRRQQCACVGRRSSGKLLSACAVGSAQSRRSAGALKATSNFGFTSRFLTWCGSGVQLRARGETRESAQAPIGGVRPRSMRARRVARADWPSRG